jgi:hypothetical protein
MTGESITLWTVRLAVTFYALALASRIWPGGKSPTSGRTLWTMGYACFVVHVLCAFHFYHHWSHQAAWQETARQTREFTGMDSGSGLLANYAFLAVWGVDVLWWWVSPTAYQDRYWGIEFVIQSYLAFITFNATVVFATGFSRWLGIALSLMLIGVVKLWPSSLRVTKLEVPKGSAPR